jgi:hypothetical protein
MDKSSLIALALSTLLVVGLIAWFFCRGGCGTSWHQAPWGLAPLAPRRTRYPDPLSWPRDSQKAIHHVNVRVARRGVQERPRQPSHNFKPETLPELHRSLVAAHHEIELHRTEPAALGIFQRMCAHRTTHSSPCSTRGCHVATICYVRASTRLVGPQEIRSHHFPRFFGYEYFVAIGEPER